MTIGVACVLALGLLILAIACGVMIADARESARKAKYHEENRAACLRELTRRKEDTAA